MYGIGYILFPKWTHSSMHVNPVPNPYHYYMGSGR